MISAITGQLESVEADRVQLRCGALVYEVLVTALDSAALQRSLGQEITFHTIFDIEGDATRGGLAPRLIGFVRPIDKAFFLRFITVKGIGPKRALRALVQPVGYIAHAIETRNTRALVELPEIGKRTAELLVAELAGKLAEFATEHTAGAAAPVGDYQAFERDAIDAVVTLGVPRMEADRLLERAKAASPGISKTDALVREIFRQRNARG